MSRTICHALATAFGLRVFGIYRTPLVARSKCVEVAYVARMADCIFCRILAGDVPGTFVFRDERVAAFMDIRPVNRGHLLVVPVQHAPYLADIDAETAAHVMHTAQRMAAALRESSVRCEGINLFLADGEAAMQEVFHLHLHVFPRFAGDGFGLRFSAEYYKSPPERDDLDQTAASIRSVMPEHRRHA